jgi:hypothetical protein
MLNDSFSHILTNPEPEASMNYFNSDMSKSTNTVVYFDWKTVIYIYVCRICRTQGDLKTNKENRSRGSNELVYITRLVNDV